MQQDLIATIKKLQQNFAKQSPRTKIALALGVGAGLILIAVLIPGRSGPRDESSKNSQDSTTGSSSQTDSADSNDPSYLSVKQLTDKAAKEYWDKKFIECEPGRAFSTYGTFYFEVRGFNVDTFPPYRPDHKDRYNKVWYAYSKLRARATRLCEGDGSCQEYEEVKEEGEFGYWKTLEIIVEKGDVTANDPFPFYKAPRGGCDEIKKQPVWQEQ